MDFQWKNVWKMMDMDSGIYDSMIVMLCSSFAHSVMSCPFRTSACGREFLEHVDVNLFFPQVEKGNLM